MSDSFAELYRLYRNHAISRREFLRRAAIVTGSLQAVTETQGAPAAQGPTGAGQSELEAIALAYRTGDRMTMGYLARPRADGAYPGVVVAHDERGLTDYFRDVARTSAAAGYMVVAPDFLSRLGGTAHFRGNEADVIRATGTVPADTVIADAGGAVAYLKSTKRLKDNKVGAVGFGWGAGSSLLAAVHHPEIRACVMFYGRPRVDTKLLAKLNAPVLAIFAGDDTETNEAIPAFEEALKKYQRRYEIKIYPGVRSGFHDQGSKERYNPEAAKDAWARTLEHFSESLKESST